MVIFQSSTDLQKLLYVDFFTRISIVQVVVACKTYYLFRNTQLVYHNPVLGHVIRLLGEVFSTTALIKEAGNSFQHISNSYFLRDEYYHCLTSDVNIIVSYKYPIIGKQVALIFFI